MSTHLIGCVGSSTSFAMFLSPSAIIFLASISIGPSVILTSIFMMFSSMNLDMSLTNSLAVTTTSVTSFTIFCAIANN